ncbi:MAG TPA: LamG domain-containing protein [Kofleriaceae bacterium]
MRRYLVLFALAACSVPEKHPGDAGTDSSGPDGPIETTITSAPDEFSNQGVATFTFTSNLPTAKFECAVDGEIATACTSPFSRSLGDGTHTFAVRATDGDGESDDTPAEHLWSIDTVAPTTTLTMGPPAADNSTMVTFEFTSNEMNVTFECRLDNGSFIACKSGDTFGPIGDGAHAFAVRARDRAANIDATPAVHSWVVDTSTPDTTLLSGPQNASPSPSATFTFISPDAGAGATFQCSLDNGAFTDCSSPAIYDGLSEGPHTFQVRVRDSVGNFDPTPAIDTWNVDLTPPDTAIASGPSGAVALASASFTFSSNEVDVAFACSLDGAGFVPCTSPFNATGLAQGPHTFSVAAIDAAGHQDPSAATASWTVDTVPPEIAIVAGPEDGSTSGPRVIFMFTMSEGTSQCSLDGAAFGACASPVAHNLAAGQHTLLIRTVDDAGNISMITRTWTVMCGPPDPTGAALLHLDDGSQIQPNAGGGPSATLGTSEMVEANDPTPITGRYSGGAGFVPAEGDLIAWPLGLPAMTDITIELWARPDALSGTRDVFVSGDGRVAIRVMQDSANTVRFVATMTEGNGVMHTVASGPVAAGAWHWVLVTLQEPMLRLWVDGTAYSTGSVSLGTRPDLSNLRLGGNYSGGLDEVYISQSATIDDEAALSRYCPL